MSSIGHIVVGVDFSEEAEVALRQALEIARHTGAKLTLLHVGMVPDSPSGVPESMTGTVTAYSRVVAERLAADRDALASLRERFEGQGVDVSHAVLDGFPDTGLVDAGKELDADLVVVGTHGRTGVRRFLLGSVAERVVRLANRPVLVARPGEPPAGGFKKILVPTDFSETANEALGVARQLVADGGAIHLLNAWQLPPMSNAYYAPVKAADDLFKEVRGELAAAAQKQLDEAAASLSGEFQVTASNAEGPAAPVIQDWMEKNHPDLVVTGSHGRRGIRRFLLGSVAELTVRHSTCSVLVVHPVTRETSE